MQRFCFNLANPMFPNLLFLVQILRWQRETDGSGDENEKNVKSHTCLTRQYTIDILLSGIGFVLRRLLALHPTLLLFNPGFGLAMAELPSLLATLNFIAVRLRLGDKLFGKWARFHHVQAPSTNEGRITKSLDNKNIIFKTSKINL